MKVMVSMHPELPPPPLTTREAIYTTVPGSEDETKLDLATVAGVRPVG
jgi:hypothetical protein